MNPQLRISFELPAWVDDFCRDVPPLAGPEERMGFVIAASRRQLAEATGGPFAAAVFERDSGQLVSLGVNLVASQGLSMLHAEMVAIASAQRLIGGFDLGAPGLPAHELVSSTEPCAMCYGAVPWSGVRRLVTGARDEDARGIGFDEGPKVREWATALRERGIEVLTDILRRQAAEVLDDYAAHGGLIYNGRRG